MVQIFPAVVISLYWKEQTKEATTIGLILGLAVTFTVYATGTSFEIYEGFWGLLVNTASTIILNPLFAKKKTNHTNSVIEQLFNKKDRYGSDQIGA